MNQTAVKPERITKPIQLLGAWLAGLLAVDSSFLIAAANLRPGSWESQALIVAAIVNVPLFLVAVFILQTRFRPELQEDSYYSTYLSRRTNRPINVDKGDAQFIELSQKLVQLEKRLPAAVSQGHKRPSTLTRLTVGVNTRLSDGAAIRAKLAELGVGEITGFSGGEGPKRRVVAISGYLPTSAVDEVARVARELHFEGYTIFDNRAEMTEEDVLFGAYGDVDTEFGDDA